MKKLMIFLFLSVFSFLAFAEKVASPKKNYFYYEGQDKYHVKISGFHFYGFRGNDEYYIPLCMSFEENNETKIFALETSEDESTFTDGVIILFFSRDGVWYVGRYAINTDTNNHPHMNVFEVRNRDEAIVIMTEMFSVHGYMIENYDQFGFGAPVNVDNFMAFMDLDDVDWDTAYGFMMTVPREIVRLWGFYYSYDTVVDVKKYNKLNGQLINPYDFYISHPLMLCNCLNCTLGDSLEYGIQPYGNHYSARYHETDTYTKIDIVDTSAKWNFTFVEN